MGHGAPHRPDHVGALKGLAFLYFKSATCSRRAHLEAAQRAAPTDPGVAQALAMAARGPGGGGADTSAGGRGTEALTEPEPIAPAAQPLEEARVFAGLEGRRKASCCSTHRAGTRGAAQGSRGPGRDGRRRRLSRGRLPGSGAHGKLLGLGKWTGLAARRTRPRHLAAPSSDALLLVVRDRAVPSGTAAIIAQRAALAARRWLEAHA